MLNLKSIVTTGIVLSSVLIHQSAMAYPRTSKGSEMKYLKSMLRLYFGQSNANYDRYVEKEYRNKTDDSRDALAAGYEICDNIQAANQQGFSQSRFGSNRN